MNSSGSRTGIRRTGALLAIPGLAGMVVVLAPTHVAIAAAPNAWTAVASMPVAGTVDAATGADGTIYAIGLGDYGACPDPSGPMNAYDPGTNAWTARAPMITSRQRMGTATGRDGRIYAVGGRPDCGGSTFASTAVEAYDPTSNAWSALASLQTGRVEPASTVGQDGTVYAIGGLGDPHSDHRSYGIASVEAYTPSTNAWTSVAPLPTARAGLGATTGPDGRIYAIGGYANDAGDPVAEVAVYTPSTNSWATAAPIPPVYGVYPHISASMSTDGGIYVTGLYDNGVNSIVYRYDTYTNTWSAVAPTPAYHAQFESSTAGRDGRIYDLGGGNGRDGSLYANVEAYTPNFHNSTDFDGDQNTDRTVYRPGTGTWYSLNSTGTPAYTGTTWGAAGDIPVSADYLGAGSAQDAVFRPSTGTWYIRHADGTYDAITWGASGDIPVPADYDGTGSAQVAVFRPSTGTWFVRHADASYTATTWGQNGDVPVPGNYEGVGVADIAVYRPSTGTWFVLKQLGGYTATTWGASGDVPVQADYEGIGMTDIAVYRPSTGVWYALKSAGGYTATTWGASGDIPVVSDYSGDGIADIAVYRPSSGSWYVLNKDGTYSATIWGAGDDVPTVAPAAIR